MIVTKMTAHDGRVFYEEGYSNESVRRVAQALGGLYQVDIIEMTEEAYRAIPATNDSATAFAP